MYIYACYLYLSVQTTLWKSSTYVLVPDTVGAAVDFGYCIRNGAEVFSISVRNHNHVISANGCGHQLDVLTHAIFCRTVQYVLVR